MFTFVEQCIKAMTLLKYDLIEELKWRGMIQDVMPGTQDFLKENITAGYIGFDPTAESLHIGSLVQIVLLMHLLHAGHRPIALIGGATGMVGDPSGKSEERNLLDPDSLNKNISGVRKQLEKILSYQPSETSVQFVNNYEWFKDMGFLQFIRDVGKHITVNYMMAKDSVKKRLETGISFTEFSYQLIQGYDFYWLHTHHHCRLQMGGADQWGNMTTGAELIRRLGGGPCYAFTTPLITKSDGGKFGKTEKGNVWLDPKMTSPYEFYQFWLNVSDEDAEKYIRIFTFLQQAEINALVEEHKQAYHQRLLQKTLSAEVTRMVHSEAELNKAIAASEILFGKATNEQIKSLDEETLLSVFAGVPRHEVHADILQNTSSVLDLIATHTTICHSKTEARRLLQSNSISINKEKMEEAQRIDTSYLLNDTYILVQKGKKEYHLIMLK